MRLEENPALPSDGAALVYTLKRVFGTIANKVNALADGRLVAVDNARTAAPTTGTWAQGDFVRNSAPVEAGTAGSKYVLFGWTCVAGGTPGTWLPFRPLTGN